MNVVRVGFASINDICCVLVPADRERGPEGLALWNGEEWKWIYNLNGWTLGLEKFNAMWATLDFSGKIRFYDGGAEPKTFVAPFGLNDMCSQSSDLIAAGIDGQFIRITENTWESISNSVQNDLYSVCGVNSSVYACGRGGVILRYLDGVCQQIKVSCDIDFTSLWSSKDGEVFVVGGEEEDGVLVDVNRNKVYSLPSRQYSLWGLSKTELYGIDLDGQIWIWNGEKATRNPISDQIYGHCISRSRAGLVIGGEDIIAIKEKDHFRIIPVNLDPAFLEEKAP